MNKQKWIGKFVFVKCPFLGWAKRRDRRPPFFTSWPYVERGHWKIIET